MLELWNQHSRSSHAPFPYLVACYVITEHRRKVVLLVAAHLGWAELADGVDAGADSDLMSFVHRRDHHHYQPQSRWEKGRTALLARRYDSSFYFVFMDARRRNVV